MSGFSNADTGSKPADPYTQKNLEEPSLKEKVEDLLTFVDKTKFCLLTTQEGHGFDLLFHTNTESGKTDDLKEHKAVNIGFINSSGEWASISGHASIETDREVVRKHYSPALKAWIGDLGDGTHDGGPEDPRIGIIRVKASTAQYAVSKKTQIGGFVELAKGIATGDSPSINKLRQISEAEIQQYRSQFRDNHKAGHPNEIALDIFFLPITATMEDPVKEIPAVIHLLTQSPPSLQRATIEKYFTPNAAFSHPFCRTWSGPNSRWLVQATYRWYKIMSPRIDLTVQSVAFDEANLTLYVTIFQIFRIWAVPFYYAPVRLTTVLSLRHSPSMGKYYIEKQDDLYQVDQWIRFVAPGGWMLVWLWQAWATFFCVLGMWLLWPVTWIEENWGWGEGVGMDSSRQVKMGEKEGEVRSDGLGKDEVLGLQAFHNRHRLLALFFSAYLVTQRVPLIASVCNESHAALQPIKPFRLRQAHLHQAIASNIRPIDTSAASAGDSGTPQQLRSMSDHTASLEGTQSPSRRRTPPADDPQYHYESFKDTEPGAVASAPHTRRRPSRTSSGTKGSPLSASPPYGDDQNDSERKPKPPRNTLKKLLRRDSHQGDTTPSSRGRQEELEEEGSNVGYIPRLGQIRERKTSMPTRRRGSSAVSSSGQLKALRRRHTEDSAVSRSRVQRKHGSQQRHSGKLAQLSEPSSASSVSQQSSTSSGSNSTVTTLKSRDEHSPVYHYEASENMQSVPMESYEVNTAHSEVFKYLQSGSAPGSPTPTDLLAMPPSTIASSSSSSSADTQLDDGRSSIMGDSQNTTISANTSQTSADRTDLVGSLPSNQEFRKFKKPLYASSFVHGPGDANEEAPEESEGGEDSYTESEEDAEKDEKPPKVTTEAPPPPRAPSVASRRSDSHTSRLKKQERELANHILKTPKPQKAFQFNAGAPAHVYPPMPMYSPKAYSVASPSVVNATPNPPQAWPPVHSFPAPLAIGYAPHQSPEVAHAYPQSVVQQMPPPFSPHSGQPPNYQQNASNPNQSKPPMSGYELLANALSAPRQEDPQRRGIVPMYRKFEHLNHRVLLHLQDETAQLEEELRHLDGCIAQMSPKDASGYAYPASRRNDARYGGEMHFKRTELLGRIFQKLEQYNRALTSFNNVSRDVNPANAEDIRTYREWMDEHEPVDYTESQYLERDSDLVAIPRKASTSPAKETGQQQQQYSVAVWFPLILVLPLMAFAIVPSLVGRLVVIVLIVGAGLKMVMSAPELKSYLSFQEWTAVASM
ncbi:bli-3 protein [Stemphylium lycopersici]|uniref:Bli-3 protein n=1 Tax=Stemphylium lycopersici TaxID=183478 RepID=A0A364NB62_STELY|nr:bli-3 protein [Stemphylium lycopersici]RAR14568.1 bli-3 protein [Stemphylium lycopersici]